MRTALLFAVAIAVGAAIGIGLKQASSESGSAIPKPHRTSAQEMRRQLAGAPAPLAALHAQAGELLPGGQRALRARLRAVRGHPAVVNVWASWCGPCRQETPVLQEVSLERGREVAFIGVNLRDERGAAQRFLRSAPVSYPSYEDPSGRIYNSYGLAGAPATIFYDARGRRAFTHQGPYLSTADLERDIERYAGGGG